MRGDRDDVNPERSVGGEQLIFAVVNAGRDAFDGRRLRNDARKRCRGRE